MVGSNGTTSNAGNITITANANTLTTSDAPVLAGESPAWVIVSREPSKEIRIDPANEPDIVGSMLDMVAVADASVDALYSAHNIEHVYAHEVPLALKEFRRVLKPEGFLVVTCPDLQTVCQLVAEDKLGEAAYTSLAGPITPLDILYGHGAAQGNRIKHG